MFSLVIAGVLGYLLGSVPTAYLLVRWKSDIDIRNAGSGNVGTLNSYVVTRSKLVGGAVLVLDVLKGIVVVLLARTISEGNFSVEGTAGVAAVIGHNFPIWLGFKGGRGLAPAAGVVLAVGWMIVVVWAGLWFIGYRLLKDVNVGNAFACVGSLLLVLLSSESLLLQMVSTAATALEFRSFAVVLFGIILARHIEPIVAFAKKRQAGRNEDRKQ